MDVKQLIQSWTTGRADIRDGRLSLKPIRYTGLAQKCRLAYEWIAGNAILSPYQDIRFGTPLTVGQGEQCIHLTSEPGYSSFLLLPLLTLLTGRRMVFVGAPGRGKTSVATLMSLLAGYSLQETRRAVQHGHPQLTIADLLGSPLPSELIRANDAHEIRVSWRKWITMRVKIIDEYNRIPTKTQSALLSLMSEGYAEMYEQVVDTPHSAWYLTANDDLGGGTFPVIEALKDRIDVVVRSTPFHSQYLAKLVDRVTSAQSPEEFLPQELIFREDELATADREIRDMSVQPEALELLGFLLGQLDFCRRASNQLEFMTKDTLHLSGRRVGHVCTEDCPLDKAEHLCTQTESGVSARVYHAVIHYGKALAWMRGRSEVTFEEFRQLLPWTLHHKLQMNPQSEFFQREDNKIYLTDRNAWIGQLADRAREQFAAYKPVRDRVRLLQEECADLEQQTTGTLSEAMVRIEQSMKTLLRENELAGPLYEDLLLLKHLRDRCHRQLERRQSGGLSLL